MSAAARSASASHVALVYSLQVKKETSTVVLNTAKLELAEVLAGGGLPLVVRNELYAQHLFHRFLRPFRHLRKP